MPINHLHKPDDMFSKWLGNCKAGERGGVPDAGLARRKEEDRGKAVQKTAGECSEDEEDLSRAPGPRRGRREEGGG